MDQDRIYESRQQKNNTQKHRSGEQDPCHDYHRLPRLLTFAYYYLFIYLSCFYNFFETVLELFGTVFGQLLERFRNLLGTVGKHVGNCLGTVGGIYLGTVWELIW